MHTTPFQHKMFQAHVTLFLCFFVKHFTLQMNSSRQYTDDEIDTANAQSDLSSRFTRQASMNTDDNNKGN